MGAPATAPEAPTVPGMDPMAGTDPNAMGGDPMAAGADPAAAGDEEFAPMGDAADVPEDAPVEGEPEGKGDSTEDIISQLSQDDREAVRAYAQSMLNRDKTVDGEVTPPEMPGMEDADAAAGDPSQQGNIMMEMSKARLEKVQKFLKENPDMISGNGERKKNSDREILKKTKGSKNFRHKSPFNSPLK